MDGVSLSHLIPTFDYDLEPSTARHLITLGCAEELSPSRPALVVPIDEPGVLEVLTRGVSVTLHRRPLRTSRDGSGRSASVSFNASPFRSPESFIRTRENLTIKIRKSGNSQPQTGIAPSQALQ
jgi:hypothetical protein